MKTIKHLFVVFVMVVMSASCLAQTGWHEQTSPTTNDLYSVFFASADSGWAVGELGTILFTANGGQTWSQQTPAVPGGNIRKVFFLNKTKGWAVGDTVIQVTTNAGGTWTRQGANIKNLDLWSVHFELDVSNQIGWAVGGYGMDNVICKTTNGGIDWEKKDSTTTMPLYDVFFVNSIKGWTAGFEQNIFYTTNIGLTWTPQASGYSSFPLFRGLYFTDQNNGWAVGFGGQITHTSNGGTSWFPQSTGLSEYMFSVYFNNPDTGWVVGGGGKILYTTNAGSNWNQMSSGLSNALYGVCFADSLNGWIVGAGGKILHTTTGGFAAIDEMKNPFNLRVYPNPTNTNITIELNNKSHSSVSVNITDAQGRIVYNLNLDKTGAAHKSIDVSGFAKGFYFVKVESNNSRSIEKIIVY